VNLDVFFKNLIIFLWVLSLEIMDLAPRKRSKIITVHEHTSLTQREIAGQCDAISGVVNKIIKLKMRLVRFHLKGRDNVGPKGKRPLKTLFLLSEWKIDPRETSFDLQKDLATCLCNTAYTQLFFLKVKALQGRRFGAYCSIFRSCVTYAATHVLKMEQ
jgi:hypothetical protein